MELLAMRPHCRRCGGFTFGGSHWGVALESRTEPMLIEGPHILICDPWQLKGMRFKCVSPTALASVEGPSGAAPSKISSWMPVQAI